MRIKKKRSQIALFFILGFIIVIGIGFTIYVKNKGKSVTNIKQISELPLNIQPVKIFVEDCMKEELKEVAPNFAGPGCAAGGGADCGAAIAKRFDEYVLTPVKNGVNLDYLNPRLTVVDLGVNPLK